VFSDPDAGDVLTLSVTSSDETVVTVLIDGDSLIITEVGLGSSTITVTATDNGTPVLSVSDAFTVTVNDINGAPVVAAPLPDLELNEYFVSDTIDLTGVFSDPDAGDVLTLSVTSSDQTVVTVLIDGDSLIITEVGLGSSTVTVTATDNGTPVLSVSDAFTVTVNDINGAPVVVAPLPDLELNEYFVSDTIDLTGVFSDPDAGDVLTLSVTSSDETVVTVLIEGDSLIITEVGLGSSTVTVTATDNGTPVLSVSDAFTVTVNDINGAPVVAAPLPDLVLNEYFVSDTIDLTGVFSDPDAGDVLTLSVTSSDETVVTVLIEGDSLIITEVGLGSSTVTVTATDNGTPVLSVSDAFTVTVNDINGAPVVVAALPDLELDEYFVSDTIDLTGVFSDPDAGDVLTLSVTSSDETVVTVLIDGDSLIITEVGLGSSTVTVTATDNGTPVLSVSDAFTVTVNDINGAPVVVAPLPDLELDEYFVSDTIDLTGVFSDPDAGDVLTLSVTSSDETVVTVLIDGDSLIITEVGLGSSTVTVTATDNGTPVLSVSDAFTVTVNDINGAPVVAAPLPDLELNEYFVSDTIDLTGVFSDPDAGDVLTLSVTSSDETVVTVLIDGDSLIITEVGLGSSTVTVTATDNGTPVLSVSDAFTVTVNDINGAPVVVAPLPDLVLNEYFVSDTIDLTGVFSDPDAGDVLTLSVTSSDETVVTVLIDGDSLIITEVGLGSSTVTVTATDNGTPVLSVSDAFTVTVNDINGAPVVVAPLPDLELNEYFVSDTIDLTGVFSDPDAGDVLTLSVTSSDETVVTVLIEGDSLIITEVGLGSSTITVTATDNGTPVLSVSDAFTVTMNGAPLVAAPVADQLLDEGFVSTTIDLTGVFTDPESDALTYSAVSSNEAVVTVSVTGAVLTITEAGPGTSDITVTASDGSLSVDDVFSVTVNGAPVVAVPIADQLLNEGFVSTTIDLSLVFDDPEGDLLTYSAVSSNEAVVTVSVTDAILTITEVGLGTATITVSASDGRNSTDDQFAVSVSVNLPADWTFNPNNYNFSGQVTAKVFLEGTEVTRGYLGSFVNGQCRGYVRASYFSLAGHYVFDLLSYSNNSTGDTLQFKYYDPVSQVTYDIHETIPFVPDMIEGDARYPIALNYCIEYQKTLYPGWNWFSINILKDDMSLDAFTPETISEGDNIKNQTQTATYYDNFGWFGQLEYLDPADFYKTYIQVESEINTCGNSIDLENTTIDLVSGWNYLGYLPLESQEINQSLSSLNLVELDYIKSQSEAATYYDGYGWFGGLKQMRPHEGYMIKLAGPGTLQYPDLSAKKAAVIHLDGHNETGFNPFAYEHSGSVTARVFIDGMPAQSADDILMAYVGEQLRGVVKAQYFDPSDAYVFQMLIYSNIAEGEEVTFRYYHADSDHLYLCDKSIVFNSDMVVADAFNALNLNVKGVVGEDDVFIAEGISLQTYPNPFDGILKINITTNEPTYLQLAVYDMMGKMIKLIVEDEFATGSYTYDWNASNLSSGTYIIRAALNEQQIQRRVTLIK
jgi:archaellum component FlaF (FlaF/FlaG flagellin family)